MTKAYIKLIDEQIEKQRKFIEELETTKRTLETLLEDERSKPKFVAAETMELDTSPVMSKSGITRGPHIQKKLISDILDILEDEQETLTSAAIMSALRWTGKKQRVWAALAKMKKDGVIVHDKDAGTYRLINGDRDHGTVKAG